ncbi:MAG: TIGR03619 family F420-dependent LLM class oxidoreductase [Gammaproteobacteria bacterium]|nr:TIGR03619 family F420-dependent LLM class oxidoreductase [Gammaproteobacteria bacterium]
MKIGISLPVREMRDDLIAIKDFAQAAEDLGLTHLRVPDQVFRKNSGHLREPMMLLSYIAAVTTKIELVPSVIVLPVRQTVLFAKQAVELDRLSEGRVRLGIGVGGSIEEYDSMGVNFRQRGRRCSEQMALLKQLWCGESVQGGTRYDAISSDVHLDPLPVQQPIPMWIGGAGVPSEPVRRRIGELADGWFVLCDPSQFVEVRDSINSFAEEAGRNPIELGMEAGVAVVGPRKDEWQERVTGWQALGLTHLCLRTLGGGIEVSEHVPTMRNVVEKL